MSNMRCCRFRNTLADLNDCWDYLDFVEELSEDESGARENLIKLCQDITNDYGDQVQDDPDD